MNCFIGPNRYIYILTFLCVTGLVLLYCLFEVTDIIVLHLHVFKAHDYRTTQCLISIYQNNFIYLAIYYMFAAIRFIYLKGRCVLLTIDTYKISLFLHLFILYV